MDEKCPFCKSDNLEFVREDFFSMEYQNCNLKSQQFPDGRITIPICKYLCLDCGMAFSKATDKNIQDFKEYQPYFKR